jgi:hypothetical protein
MWDIILGAIAGALPGRAWIWASIFLVLLAAFAVFVVVPAAS